MKLIRRLYFAGTVLGGMIIGLLALIITADQIVILQSKKHILSWEELDQAEIPVAVVPGTSKFTVRGTRNLYYYYRLEAVYQLYQENKVNYILVSGDNRKMYYDEPTTMKNDLIEMGVPRERIYRDHAGYRTLDTVVRAQKVFSADRFLFVSQPFQNERAIFIGRAHGIEVMGFNARDVSRRGGFRTRQRERLARLAAVLDIYIWNTEPYFLGPEIPIGIVPGN